MTQQTGSSPPNEIAPSTCAVSVLDPSPYLPSGIDTLLHSYHSIVTTTSASHNKPALSLWLSTHLNASGSSPCIAHYPCTFLDNTQFPNSYAWGSTQQRIASRTSSGRRRRLAKGRFFQPSTRPDPARGSPCLIFGSPLALPNRLAALQMALHWTTRRRRRPRRLPCSRPAPSRGP